MFKNLNEVVEKTNVADLYSLKKKKSTDEIHIFKAKLANVNSVKKCQSSAKSVCSAVDLVDCENQSLNCLDSKNTRMEAAKLGRPVCGLCVSTLYTTYKK